MSELTKKLGLYLPGGGSTGTNTPDEVIDIDKLNNNFQKIDASVGMHEATSTAMPASPYKNMLVYVSDINTLKTWTGDKWVVVASNYDSGIITDAVEKADDWDLVSQEVQIRGASTVYLYVRVKYTGSKAINIPSNGNITNQVVAKLKSEDNWPVLGNVSLSTSHTGDVASGSLGNTTGNIYLTAVSYRSDGIKKGSEYTLAGMYTRQGSI